MKTYKVTYEGNASKFKGFERTVTAVSEREAVMQVYQLVMNDSYFPQDDGSIKDCDGHTVADAGDSYIEYDGGYFSANEEDEEYLLQAHNDAANKILEIIRKAIKGSGCTVNGQWISNLGSTHGGNNDPHLFAVVRGGWLLNEVVTQKGVHFSKVVNIEESAHFMIEDLRDQMVVPGLTPEIEKK